jgi:uncharacterized protein YjiS (DUF1127 family)
MKRFYLATMIAIVVTTSIASHLYAVGALGSTTSSGVPGRRSRTAVFLHRLKRYLDGSVAAARAYKERRATMLALRHVDDRLLKDIGVYRDGAIYDLRRSAWRQRDVRELPHSPPIQLT